MTFAATWCSRCGRPYESERPTCECAGDPPIDHDSPEWAAWLDRVRRLEWTDGPHRG